MIPLYEDRHFTFRFADDRRIPRFHLEGVEAGRLVSSRIGEVETIRATSRREVDVPHRNRILTDIEFVEVTPSIAAAAAIVHPPLLGTLDAIHLATALALVPDLDAFVTYDDRLAEAARAIGLPVVRPA